MATCFVRYVDRSTIGPLSVEVAFYGGAEVPLGNPLNTNVSVRFLSRANPHQELSPWIERWVYAAGDPIMPSGAWNGIKITEIVGNRVFVAIGTELSEFDVETGKAIWTLTTGNTPIYWIMKSRDATSLIVFNGYYEFERNDELSNVASVSLNGVETWRSPRPFSDDVFANRPHFDRMHLKASSWNGFTCTIDESTGEIIDRQFTK